MDKKEIKKHFIETLYDTLDTIVSPTPYMEIVEDKDVEVKLLNGRGRLPSPNSTEITILDIDIASLFFDDFHVLYEGVTGVGKTYTSDALFNAIFGSEGHYTLRLSGGILGSSALEPFTQTTLENGVPKTRIDQKKCQQYGALFIDEINRGDSQEVLQVVDGKININGDTGDLKIPIDDNNYKKLAIIAAMNPADSVHKTALELGIAEENRFLKFKFPNGVGEAGSSQLEKKANGNLHERFWNNLKDKTGIEGGWRDNYPRIADSSQFDSMLEGDTKEFIDLALGYVGYDPKETFERNLDLMTQSGIIPNFSIRQDNNYKKIRESQGNLKHGFVRRDLVKIKDLSRLLGFIKGVKNKTYDAKVQLNDVVASMGIILESKTVTGTEYGSMMVLVNDARVTYSNMREQMNVPEGYGIRQSIWQSAVYAGIDNGFDAYVNTLRKGIEQFNATVSSSAEATMRSRIISDLVVMEHFSKAYEKEVTQALKSEDVVKSFSEIYHNNKSKASVYEHRLDSILR